MVMKLQPKVSQKSLLVIVNFQHGAKKQQQDQQQDE